MAALLFSLSCFASGTAQAAVVVIANRTDSLVRFEITPLEGEPTSYNLDSDDVLPIPVTASVTIRFDASGESKEYDLVPNSVYFFHAADGTGLDLDQLGLHGQGARRALKPESEPSEMADYATVTVRIFVDEEERTTPKTWQERLTNRVARASDIFEKHCRVRFKVIGTSTWPSDDAAENFQASLKNFERMVTAHPADLAIGFSSQRPDARLRTELGGTRAPFHPYILIREGTRVVGEPEKLEVLVHELGHYLGASHSPEPTSVMRPGQGDRRALLLSHRIGFDPVNTLIMYMIGEEMRRRPVRALKELDLDTRLELREIYSTLAATMPEDPAARIYVRLLGIIDPVTPVVPGKNK